MNGLSSLLLGKSIVVSELKTVDSNYFSFPFTFYYAKTEDEGLA